MSAAPSEPEVISIRDESIELSQLLKYAGVFGSGGEAKFAINNGEVTVNGVVDTAARRKITPGTVVACEGRVLRVSR